MLGLPARAVRWHQHIGCHVDERSHGGLDDGLEGRSGEVETAEQGMQPVHTGQPHRVPGDVHRTGVAAPGEHHESAPADVDHQRLLVEDQRVGLPPPVAPGLVVRQAALELRGAVVAQLTPRYLAMSLPVWPSAFIRLAVATSFASRTFIGRPNLVPLARGGPALARVTFPEDDHGANFFRARWKLLLG